MTGAAHFSQQLARALAAGHRGLAIHTHEEARALELLEAAASAQGRALHTYSPVSGDDGDGRPAAPIERLGRWLRDDQPAVWALLDGDRWLRSDLERRALRELCQRESGPTVVIIGDAGPATLSLPELPWLPLPLPDADELAAHLRWIGQLLGQGGRRDAAVAIDAAAGSLARLGLGLERLAFEQLVAEALALDEGSPETRPETARIAAHLHANKAARLDAQGIFEAVQPVPLDEVGGLEHYKAWLERRALALHPEARRAGIPAPRGVLLVGVQGCGKSLAARASASALRLPLFRVDPGRLFAGLVGESEANLRRLLATAERLAPVVLWLDEIDKSLAGVEGSHSDAGTAARVLAGLLTWLQERVAPVFVVATANRIDALPPELLRRGRLDETFFVDLPDAAARAAILRVHLGLRAERTLGLVPPFEGRLADFDAEAARAEGFSGAELEAALIEARLDAFAEGRPVSAADLRRALVATVPLSVSRADTIERLRAWARHGARPAAGPPGRSATNAGQGDR